MDFLSKKRGTTEIHGAHGHKIELSDQMLAVELSGLLSKHYPGHEWLVCVNSDGGVIDIKNLLVSGQYGFRLVRPWNLPHDMLRHQVIMAGGEILERAGLKRGKVNDQVAEVENIEGITKPNHQPGFIKAIQRYRSLLNGQETAKN